MKIAMIYPNPESENAMSNYSLDLIGALKNKNIESIKGEYIFHKPFSLFKILPKLMKCNIIHMQHEYNILGWKGLPFFPLLLFLKFFFRGKTILTMHNVPSKKTRIKESKIKNLLRKTLYLNQNMMIKYFSDYTITHCEYFKKILVNEYCFNEKKISVIPQAIKGGIKTINKKTARRDLRLSGKIYLIIGTFVPDHGAAEVVKQADKINGKILIVTNPSRAYKRNDKRVLDYLNYVKTLSENPLIKRKVRFDLKEIPFDLWWKYFTASDLVLLPYKEGLASGIFSDAIAMKIPMIGSDIKYFKEFAEKYGIIKIAEKGDFASAINQAMKSDNYKKMKRNMEWYIQKFGVSSIGNKYKSLYRKILALNS